VAAAPARLACIAIFPVKACRAIPLADVGLGAHGLAGDREWMVVRPDGRFLSQRTHPALARIQPIRTSVGLRLTCDAQAPLELDASVVRDGARCEVSVWDDRLAATDAGEIAAAWLAQAIATPARLVLVGAAHARRASRDWVGERDVPVAFADGFPVLVCSTASLAELNRRLPVPVPMDRFRPNLVVDGLEPFAEDRIRRMTIGAVTLDLVKPCTRCSVPGIDQETGLAATDPFPALRAFRWDATLRGATFGVNAVATGPADARLTLGMPVVVG
jgi:uncharacterized protein YcbX